MMKQIAIAFAATLLLAGCQSESSGNRALVGGGLGAATGAAVGAAATGDVGGALAGAAIGGVGGAAIGAATTPRNCIATDSYGRRYYTRC